MTVQMAKNIRIKPKRTPESPIAHLIIQILPLAVEVALQKVSKPLVVSVPRKEAPVVPLVKA
jgi:hypothetical protein